MMNTFRAGFLVDDVPHAWGTLLGTVCARHAPTLDVSRGQVELRSRKVLSFDTIGVGLTAPRADRPVYQVQYALDEAAALHMDVGLERMIARLEASLGPGSRTDVPRPSSGFPPFMVRTTVQWTFAPSSLTFSAFGGVRDTPLGRTTGGLYLAHDVGPLAAPFVERFRAAGARLDRPSLKASAIRIRSAGIGCMGGSALGAVDDPDAHLAFYSPHLEGPPRWAREELRGGEIAIVIDDSGALALVTRDASWTSAVAPSSTVLSLERVRPAKGSGGAYLSTADGRSLVDAHPGEDALDRVAERLRKLGVRLDIRESYDA